MTDFVLARHGETIWHENNRYAGRTDIALTSHGQQQAKLLGLWARGAGLVACVSSPLTRARATAHSVAIATGLTTRIDERLAELDFGQGEGKTAQEMSQLFGERHAAFERDPVTHHLPGGEDPRDAVRRATTCLVELAAEYPQQRVLIVWHSTLMRLVLCQFLGVPLSNYRKLFPFIRNSGLTEVRLVADTFSLLEYNTPIEPSHRRLNQTTRDFAERGAKGQSRDQEPTTSRGQE